MTVNISKQYLYMYIVYFPIVKFVFRNLIKSINLISYFRENKN